MPQDIEFTVPLAGRVSPELARARRRHLAWVRASGLVGSGEALRRYESSRVADSAAYGVPDATGTDLDLCFDLLGWFFLFNDQFDDQFDGRDGCTGDAIAVCQDLVDLLRWPKPRTTHAPPVVAAFADCWQRMSAGMSEEWRRRTVHDWVDYLAGWPTKIAERAHGVLPAPSAHLRARRRTIGVRPLLALAERAGHFEVPLRAWCSSHLEAMRIAACDAIIAMNEIHSLEKDQAGGRPNLVLSLMRHHGASRAEAVRQVCDTVDRSVGSFLDLRAGLPALERELGGKMPELARYADAHAAWIRGYHDWGRAAPRYTTGAHPGDLGLENLAARQPN
ncbi:terpene synthase family protein [Streptomyces sp. CBMA123]|uniref:terpene synthase family protein n=1 Tax=Streptomyces sp. CBMA123 TaxID=1896313 RepID=UPI001661968F|nr:pentalenene synthase [Streptomyces sp. CBMA123]MBD0692943.1 pentalenene synthase [Streptomyces sp. CBMA123]